ncbi:adenylate/guanylate cyclase domain-containing protein [Nocardioides seonyuensis]|uniref:Adenylate/guanylate cyclase domain-containing protein n=1 Tax=Nocardioides seonyuensis TaxID=2518371 RepID=A0A4P7IGZ6_9ACTN|nr:adenylate/guanylate cyclase domain-containing protein [Nocardioides seonyuensis]QBX55377.1 adenylate/guanylate cyclase domain-containing protein [Nocardioides seonyuensis]
MGDLSRTVEDLEAFLLGESPSLTRVEVSERAGVPLDLAEELWHHLGFPHHSDEDIAFAPSDVEALKTSVELVALGILSGDSQAALVRTWGRSYARLADWQVSLLAGIAVEGPDPDARLTELALEALPRVEQLQAYVWRRHLASAASRLLSETDSLVEGEARMAVCFVDIVGYTAQSKALDEHELVTWIENFERETTATVVDHGGRVIKTIGDEVLFTVDDPAAAVDVALELTRRGADDDDLFPQVRAGIAYGPVVRRLGDVYGSTVNVAARLTSVARPGAVVVDHGTHDAMVDETEDKDEEGPRWRRLRRVSVKGFSKLEAWVVRSPGGQ